ncbi:MAG: 23S rRNA (adenine(2030)-N(6))-methyltransferase RlmJ [Alphaproteobacteria bacterium CG_4_9_14_3_um_filter_47_13]|nr:MAG: 23S rRNA (adenine(2030)-N(6))-methyltransferase RlmJ [Alphaproteobacteria bacterium CG_4_9_14_3_um_filter_47_13]
MLSYQHIYHAGGPADLHKHSILCAMLADLCTRYRALSYMETHAGRGLYDLQSVEAMKTGEAARGWLAEENITKAPSKLLEIIKKLNHGKTAPLYPGSPLIAAHMLRSQDRLHLMELHPQEHAALCKTFAKDNRVHIRQQDGYQSVLDLAPPMPRRGLVLIDPSYEIKDEYREVAGFIERLRRRWNEAVILLWYPLLPAGRHEEIKIGLATQCHDMKIHEYIWDMPEGNSGMYGSGMIVINGSILLS